MSGKNALIEDSLRSGSSLSTVRIFCSLTCPDAEPRTCRRWRQQRYRRGERTDLYKHSLARMPKYGAQRPLWASLWVQSGRSARMRPPRGTPDVGTSSDCVEAHKEAHSPQARVNGENTAPARIQSTTVSRGLSSCRHLLLRGDLHMLCDVRSPRAGLRPTGESPGSRVVTLTLTCSTKIS